ncbi:MAG: SDR family oxidoreductase [Anaerolineales bacterium]|jgi:NAD(P)-dependent dehydrogenase (short-subunit alcohol dehydrogenase family)
MNGPANAHRLEGQIAVVTGAASGIGRATAELFAREEGEVWILDQNEEQGNLVVDEIQRHGGLGHFLRLDVADPEQVQQAANTLKSRSGRVDTLCNCAGVGTRSLAVTELPIDAWDQILSVNLRGTFLVCKVILPLMPEAGGSIVNVAIMGGLIAWTRNAPAYCASKGGVIALTRAMAVDHAAQGIRVNCICPGVIETPLTERRLSEPDYRARMIRRTPLGRIGQPLEVAYAALFLASHESSFVTGQALVVDGGWTAQ